MVNAQGLESSYEELVWLTSETCDLFVSLALKNPNSVHVFKKYI